MIQTVRPEKLVEKNWVICLVSELWSLNCLKKIFLCNFGLNSEKNLSLSKQFT